MTEISINIKSMDGNNFAIRILTTDTVAQMKQKIQATVNVPPDSQRLIFQGKVLKEEQSISESRITADSTVHLILRAPGSQPSAPSQPPGAANVQGVPGGPFPGFNFVPQMQGQPGHFHSHDVNPGHGHSHGHGHGHVNSGQVPTPAPGATPEAVFSNLDQLIDTVSRSLDSSYQAQGLPQPDRSTGGPTSERPNANLGLATVRAAAVLTELGQLLSDAGRRLAEEGQVVDAPRHQLQDSVRGLSPAMTQGGLLLRVLSSYFASLQLGENPNQAQPPRIAQPANVRFHIGRGAVPPPGDPSAPAFNVATVNFVPDQGNAPGQPSPLPANIQPMFQTAVNSLMQMFGQPPAHSSPQDANPAPSPAPPAPAAAPVDLADVFDEAFDELEPSEEPSDASSEASYQTLAENPLMTTLSLFRQQLGRPGGSNLSEIFHVGPSPDPYDSLVYAVLSTLIFDDLLRLAGGDPQPLRKVFPLLRERLLVLAPGGNEDALRLAAVDTVRHLQDTGINPAGVPPELSARIIPGRNLLAAVTATLEESTLELFTSLARDSVEVGVPKIAAAGRQLAFRVVRAMASNLQGGLSDATLAVRYFFATRLAMLGRHRELTAHLMTEFVIRTFVSVDAAERPAPNPMTRSSNWQPVIERDEVLQAVSPRQHPLSDAYNPAKRQRIPRAQIERLLAARVEAAVQQVTGQAPPPFETELSSAAAHQLFLAHLSAGLRPRLAADPDLPRISGRFPLVEAFAKRELS